MGSGTLPLVKYGATLLSRSKVQACLAAVPMRQAGSENSLANPKVSRPSTLPVWPGQESKGSRSKAPPNPSVNRTPHGMPGLGLISFWPNPVLPRGAGYLER